MHASSTVSPGALSPRRIFRFWWPLASTWLLMAVEGIVLSAVVARLAEPRENLAAYGVAFAFAIIVEAPVILLMSASTALARNGQGYRGLWRFTWRLCLLVSVGMVVLVLPPVWEGVAGRVGLQPRVAELVHGALLWLLPWPAAIGDRRFHQGLLIRAHHTGRVAQGTVVRVLSMAATALVLARWGGLPGASVAGAALSVGVVAEMLVVRRMVAPLVRRLREEAARAGQGLPEALRLRGILRFYLPLALTSVIALAAQPVITFFMGRAPRPLESLAVLPVIHGITFVFRALALSYQEVGIALIGEKGEHARAIRDFAGGLAVAVFLCLGLFVATPLAPWWLDHVAGLDPELRRFALGPLRVYAFLPALSVVQAWQRSVLVHGRKTGPIGRATAVELAVLTATLVVSIQVAGMIGAYAAALATLVGRTAGLAVLTRPLRQVGAGRPAPGAEGEAGSGVGSGAVNG